MIPVELGGPARHCGVDSDCRNRSSSLDAGPLIDERAPEEWGAPNPEALNRPPASPSRTSACTLEKGQLRRQVSGWNFGLPAQSTRRLEHASPLLFRRHSQGSSDIACACCTKSEIRSGHRLRQFCSRNCAPTAALHRVAKDGFRARATARYANVRRARRDKFPARAQPSPFLRVPRSTAQHGSAASRSARTGRARRTSWVQAAQHQLHSELKMARGPAFQGHCWRRAKAGARSDARAPILHNDCCIEGPRKISNRNVHANRSASLRFKRNFRKRGAGHQAVDAGHLCGAPTAFTTATLSAHFRDAHAPAGHFSGQHRRATLAPGPRCPRPQRRVVNPTASRAVRKKNKCLGCKPTHNSNLKGTITIRQETTLSLQQGLRLAAPTGWHWTTKTGPWQPVVGFHSL